VISWGTYTAPIDYFEADFAPASLSRFITSSPAETSRLPLWERRLCTSPIFLQRPNKLLLYLLFEMWVPKVEKQWRFGNLRFDNPSTLSTKTT
jgi:hypothetical protein